MVTIVFLPQWFQLENSLSPVDSGVHMLALLLVSAVSAGLGGAISSKKNISWHILATSLGLQLLGLGLMSSLPTSSDIVVPQYIYQVILGLGFGLALSSLAIVARMEVEPKDVGKRLFLQWQLQVIGKVLWFLSCHHGSYHTSILRVLGGMISIAIAQAIMNSLVRNDLSEILGQGQLDALLRSASEIHHLTTAQAAATRESYERAFNLQSRIMMYFAAASLLVSFVAYKRHPVAFKTWIRCKM